MMVMMNWSRLVVFWVSVAPHAHYTGDGRLPGEASRRRQRALHSAADAGLPGKQALVAPYRRVHLSMRPT